MCLIGCKPDGRHIEQHDIFFGIAADPAALISQMETFWPDGGKLHLDAWRKVTRVGTVAVTVLPRSAGNGATGQPPEQSAISSARHLFFINMGGYQPEVFEEYHHKLLSVQADRSGAITAAKQSDFYKQATQSHIDDQYGVDIDDLYNVEDILPEALKQHYYLGFTDIRTDQLDSYPEDKWIIGYTKLSQLLK